MAHHAVCRLVRAVHGDTAAGTKSAAESAATDSRSVGRLSDRAALVTPLLLLVTLSIVDFSSLLYACLALENGVSQATRSAVTGNGQRAIREESIKAAMRQATPTLTIPDGAFTFNHLPAGAAGGSAEPAGRAISKRSRSTTRGVC